MRAEDLHCAGSMTALMREAIRPNLVQTSEQTPGPGSCRTVCQHRPRQLLDPGRPSGSAAGRLCADRELGSARIAGRKSSATSNAARPGWSRTPLCSYARCGL